MTPMRCIHAEAGLGPRATGWSDALLLGQELVMSGVIGHPDTRVAAERGEVLDAYAQTLLVLGKLNALLEKVGGCIGNIYKPTVYVTRIDDQARGDQA